MSLSLKDHRGSLKHFKIKVRQLCSFQNMILKYVQQVIHCWLLIIGLLIRASLFLVVLQCEQRRCRGQAAKAGGQLSSLVAGREGLERGVRRSAAGMCSSKIYNIHTFSGLILVTRASLVWCRPDTIRAIKGQFRNCDRCLVAAFPLAACAPSDLLPNWRRPN